MSQAMDKLWAPWRINYVKAKPSKKCLFCKAALAKEKNHRIFITQHSLCILNIFPYNNGHVMVAPRRHVRELSELKEREVIDLFNSISTAKALLDKVLTPQGYNIGINISDVAGAGIPGHLHVHIVPRWKGDTNFMPVLFGTKIISQSLEELQKLLKNAYAKSN
jgi:ATP adenylyltransferase